MAKRGIPHIARGKLRSSAGRHYYVVYLWANQKDYEKAADVDKSDTVAMCVTDSYVNEDKTEVEVRPKLGELHFVSGTWCINTVAHECQHAILHRMRYLDPSPALVLDELSDAYDPEGEEVIAYEAGDWVEACMAWLTNNDPASPYPAHLFDR